MWDDYQHYLNGQFIDGMISLGLALFVFFIIWLIDSGK